MGSHDHNFLLGSLDDNENSETTHQSSQCMIGNNTTCKTASEMPSGFRKKSLQLDICRIERKRTASHLFELLQMCRLS